MRSKHHLSTARLLVQCALIVAVTLLVLAVAT